METSELNQPPLNYQLCERSSRIKYLSNYSIKAACQYMCVCVSVCECVCVSVCMGPYVCVRGCVRVGA